MSGPQGAGPCPACGAPVAASAPRCLACGRVFGVDNQCPHCHAFAPALEGKAGLRCAACGRERVRGASTVVVGTARAGGLAAGGAERITGVGLRGLGVVAIGLGVLGAAISAAVLSSSAALLVAGAVGLVGVVVGALLLRAGARVGAAGAADALAAKELRIVALARDHGGSLSATEVAEGLRITTLEADGLLTRLADGTRVTVEVDAEGRVRYAFRELGPGAREPRMRVAADEELPARGATSERERGAG